MSLDIAALGKFHDRKNFDCGVTALNAYLANQVGQDIRRKVAACFVAAEKDSGKIAGYYTLSAASVALTDLPEDVARKLPRYLSIPAARLGRLAVANEFKGQGLGSVLLFDALARAIRSDLMAFAMIVDAKDAAASAFYAHHGFLEFRGKPRVLFLPLAVGERLIGKD